MIHEKFTIEIEQEKFVVVELYENEKEFSLYVLPYNDKYRGFFMTKTQAGAWEIFNKILVSREIIRLEIQFSDIINEKYRKAI